jgi:hypothetical protein
VCGRILSPHDVLKIQGDGPRDPGHEDAVAASPRRVAGTGRSVGEDVAVEDVAAKNEEKLVPPLSVGGRGGVEEDGDQVLDVRDPGGLKVEVGDHGVILATRGSSTRRRQRSGRELRRRGDTLPRGGVKRSTSTTWRARTSAVESSCSQARAATHTHSSAAAVAVLAFSRAAARALLVAATVVGRGDMPRRKEVAEKGVAVGGMRGRGAGRECRRMDGPGRGMPSGRVPPPSATEVSVPVPVLSPKTRRAVATTSGPAAAMATTVAGERPGTAARTRRSATATEAAIVVPRCKCNQALSRFW